MHTSLITQVTVVDLEISGFREGRLRKGVGTVKIA
jgi:hypothetical protein